MVNYTNINYYVFHVFFHKFACCEQNGVSYIYKLIIDFNVLLCWYPVDQFIHECIQFIHKLSHQKYVKYTFLQVGYRPNCSERVWDIRGMSREQQLSLRLGAPRPRPLPQYMIDQGEDL